MLEMTIDGVKYDQFFDLNLSMEADAISASLEFFCPSLQGISPEAELVLYHKSTPIFTGYIEYLGPEFYEDDARVQVQCRSKTADLVDCSYSGKLSQNIGDKGIKSIVSDLCKQFGITFKLEAADQKLKDFKIDPGERISSLLHSITKKTGVRFLANGDGSLLGKELKKNPPTIHLKEGSGGASILSAYLNADYSKYYSAIKVSFAPNRSISHTTTAKGKRKRFLELSSADIRTIDEAKQLAQWELTTRNASVFEYVVTIPFLEANCLIQPFDYVSLESQHLNVDAVLVAKNVNFTSNESGSFLALTLAKPDLFATLAHTF